MATTFAAFVAAIQNEINDQDAAMKARIEGWINDLHHFICRAHRWQWLIKTSDSTLIKASTHPYDLTSLKVATVTTPCRTVLDVRDEDFSPPRPLICTSEDSVRQSLMQYASSTGAPYWFYQRGDNKLGLFPIPDTTGRNYTVRYLILSTSYTTGSTNPLLIPDDWITVLKDAVLGKAYDFLDRVPKATEHKTMFLQELEVMKVQDSETVQQIYPRQFVPPDIFPNTITP